MKMKIYKPLHSYPPLATSGGSC